MNSHYRILISLLLVLFISIGQSQAQTSISNTEPDIEAEEEPQKYYDVEVIIFKFNTPINNGEVNLPTPTAIRTDDTIDFSSAETLEKAAALNFTPLLPEEFRLQEAVDKIIQSSRYTLLSHTGWRQPGLGENESIPVWITGGRIYGKGYSSIDQISTEITPVPDQPDDTGGNNNLKPATNLQNEALQEMPTYPVIRENEFYELDGLITIILSRYLHTKTDLVFRKPADTSSIMMEQENRVLTDLDVVESQLLLNYGLQEKRRMRSKRLHYLDNPQFGMLVMITPYETPIETPQTETTQVIASPVPVNPPGVIAQ